MEVISQSRIISAVSLELYTATLAIVPRRLYAAWVVKLSAEIFQICQVDLLLPLLSQPQSPLSPLWRSGRHLVDSLSPSPSQSPSLLLPHTSLSPSPSFLSLPVWVTPGWVSLWSWDGFFLLTRALPDNTAQPDTNIIKNEELLVRVPANAEMKWKVGEKRDECLTVQRERLKNSQWGPVRYAEGPMACSCADASQTGVFFFPTLLRFVLSASSPIFYTCMKNS